MLVSVKHRLVIMAMPKCASTSLETVLADSMDIVFQGAPSVKHMTFRKYDRFVRPYLASLTKEPFEVVSLFREPVSWLGSWWRYRGRPGIPRPENSTASMDFNTFVEAYLDGRRKPADVGSQALFVAHPDGSLGVDRVFRHDQMPGFIEFLERRLSRPIAIGHDNRSPEDRRPELSQDGEARLRQALAREYEIYETIAE